MLRRTFCVFAGGAAAAAAGNAPAAGSAKLVTLHKLLIGEVQLRNKTPLKVCYLEHNFGPQWQTEITQYAETLPTEQAALLQRQIARVLLTRYTTRELALYAGDGPEQLDVTAMKANVAQGKAYLDAHGAEAFEAYVRQEAKNANWSDKDADEFIKTVRQLS